MLFATFRVELLDVIERWTRFAQAEIADWPGTGGLGMTPRTEQLIDAIVTGRSVLDQPDR